MKVYRIARKEFINDLTGEGARLFGGRWNKKGTNVLYTSENRSLATVEYLVHLPFAVIPHDICTAEIEIPSLQDVEEVDVKDLPDDWITYPAPIELAEIGEAWKRRNKTLVLKVPSVVVRSEWNILINPNHPSFSDVRIVFVEEYVFDSRLIKKEI